MDANSGCISNLIDVFTIQPQAVGQGEGLARSEKWTADQCIIRSAATITDSLARRSGRRIFVRQCKA